MQNNRQINFLGLFSRSVALRLAGGYAILIAAMIVMVILGIKNVDDLRLKYETELDIRIPVLNQMQKIQNDLSTVSVGARDALTGGDPVKLESSLVQIEAVRAGISAKLEQLQTLLSVDGSSQSVQATQRIGELSSGILVSMVKFSRSAKGGKQDIALAIIQNELQPKLDKMTQEFLGYQQVQIDRISDLKKEVAEVRARNLISMTGIALLAVAIAGVISVLIIRSVLLPLRELRSAAIHMSQGDLSRSMQVKSRDEVGQVIVAFNQISEGLTKLILEIRSSADKVNETAEGINDGNSRLEDLATEQSKSLEEAMNFIRGVQAGISENMQIAAQARGQASNMSTIANKSSTSVQEAVQEMAKIKQSSEKITEIISMIDGIAFQTNILALNAAVEAARAGESGRGFAVVATEVRNLAKRSADASKEIKGLIHTSQTQVENGTSKVQSIAHVIRQVLDTSTELQGMVDKISSGSEAQSKQILEMVTSISNIESGNDNNLHLVSGLRSSSNELHDMAQELNRKVAEFKVANPTFGQSLQLLA